MKPAHTDNVNNKDFSVSLTQKQEKTNKQQQNHPWRHRLSVGAAGNEWRLTAALNAIPHLWTLNQIKLKIRILKM